MPRKLKLDGLQAELSTIKSLLADAISVHDPIGSLQYQYKKDSIEKEIEEIRNTVQLTASVALYFGGKPVYGSKGIVADFAGHVLEEYQDLISKVFAKYEYGDLGKRGKIPLQKNNQLMITEITKGSFGFILEELSDQYELTETSLKKIVNEVSEIISKASNDSDTIFEELLTEIDERTFLSLKNFFSYLDSNEATIRLIEDTNECNLNGVEIHRARLRTESTTVDDQESVLAGVLVGFLPEHKKFELRDDEGKVVYGSATNDAVKEYLEMLNSNKTVLNVKWKFSAKVRTVAPLNRTPKTVFTITKFMEQV